ncbi:sulfite exporter TauE/SafE family protein [Duganella fentianensis]|uniref:sulfite exporter TauE/SafE family protein n=1 Tax=Duganella fentianensis TaxID=2692177 RepID=UPI0032B179AC
MELAINLATLPALAGLALLGGMLGFLGGMFGIGGGIIAIPVLALAFGMEQALAQGTSLAMMVPILLLGWWRYSRHHPFDWRVSLPIGVLAVLATVLIARYATGLPPLALRVLFALFLLWLAARLLRRSPVALQPARPARSLRLMPLVGLLGGCCMGLLGVGGGLVATPVFTGVFGQRQTVAQSLSLALVTPCSLVALITYAEAGHVQWAVGLPMALGGLLTVSAGVALAHRLPERSVKRAFGVMVLLTAVWLLLKVLL